MEGRAVYKFRSESSLDFFFFNHDIFAYAHKYDILDASG